MNSKIKVDKKSIQGWFSADFDESQIALEIEFQEKQGWELISSYGIRMPNTMHGSATDTLVFIYRQK